MILAKKLPTNNWFKKARGRTLGAGLVTLGVAGLLMPIIPGFVLILLGIKYSK